jgi:hydroxymethylpyrimidine pyrophosphatase-like HAD family hydrolase
MNKLIECFITRKYYELLNIANKITKNNQLSQDLLHEVIIQLYDKSEINLKSYDDNSIKYYITSIMRINYYSTESPFYYKIKRYTKLVSIDIDRCFHLEVEQEKFESEELYQLLEQEYCELDWFRKSLLDLYLSLNSLKAVSNVTNIPIQTLSDYIRAGKKEIKKNIISKLNN